MESLLLLPQLQGSKRPPSSRRGGEGGSGSGGSGGSGGRWALALAAAAAVALAAVSSSSSSSPSSYLAPFVGGVPPVRRASPSSSFAPASRGARLLAQQKRPGAAEVATTSIKESGR